MILKLIDILHILFLLIPIIIFFVNQRQIRNLKKYILLLIVLIPLHWVFLDNHCALTLLSKKMGNYNNSETTSQFSERYLKWIYLPIMKSLGWTWNSDDLEKMVSLHWILNILLVWYNTFFFF